MGDLAGVPPFGGGGVMIRPYEAAEPPPVVPAVEPGGNSPNLSGQMNSGLTDAAQQRQPDVRQQTPEARQRFDPDTLTGPSPAFQANVLEMELDLQQTILKVEAARSQQQETAPTPPENPAGPPVEPPTESSGPPSTIPTGAPDDPVIPGEID